MPSKLQARVLTRRSRWPVSGQIFWGTKKSGEAPSNEPARRKSPRLKIQVPVQNATIGRSDGPSDKLNSEKGEDIVLTLQELDGPMVPTSDGRMVHRTSWTEDSTKARPRCSNHRTVRWSQQSTEAPTVDSNG